jgi:signal transduction histidine kinase
MESQSRTAILPGITHQDSVRAPHSPFSGPGLLARVGPFALVAVAAEASLVLPPRTRMSTALIVSLVLLAMMALAFLLPWDRLPAWTPVLVPLACTGWALALTLAAGTVSGIGLVVLIPLIWSVLFRRPWESACVVAAIVAAEIFMSVTQSVPDTVTARRVVLWAALGGLLAVSTHGLRDRIRRSQQVTAQLQERLRELSIIEDRDRLAAALQTNVVQRIFAAGLKLQGVLTLPLGAEARHEVESSVTDLDDAIRLIRQAIFGLENRLSGDGLRQRVLQLCAGQSPVPEIIFSGPIDNALPADASDQLLDVLQKAMALIGPDAVHTSVDLRSDDDLSVVVTWTSPGGPSADGRLERDFSLLRDSAGQAGIAVEVEPIQGGTRLAWSLPLCVSPPPADLRGSSPPPG